MQATITSKGQVTLLKPIRDKLHLRAGDRIELILDDDEGLWVAPVTASITQLKGMVPRPAHPVSLEETDAAGAGTAAARGRHFALVP